ncbi:MAG: ABC transporter permease [Gammaproteobacteria bacterium]|nr:ABC transporter permease [Gammaproteobacteria bacterium]
MIRSDHNPKSQADFEIKQEGRQCSVHLSGDWTLSNVAIQPALQHKLNQAAENSQNSWDLRQINVLDNITALMLWRAWRQTLPTQLDIKPKHLRLINKWQSQAMPATGDTGFSFDKTINHFEKIANDIFAQLISFITMLGQLLLDTGYLLRHPGDIPWAEISVTTYEAGVRALGITSLVGFLIGIVLSYLSALQLKLFGAEIYIIDILGISVIRELGPLLAAILVAGRSGSAMTAQIGIMRVTEELDALSAMGISHSLRLVLPKVAALSLTMPLLSVWTSAMALFGGMFSAENTLDISYQQFFLKLPDVVPVMNLYIGLGKSAVFGLMIALIACYFGFRIKPNTESLGNETTNSVVAAITVVIMVDALFAILFMDVGMP